MAIDSDFYDTPVGDQLAQAYRDNDHKNKRAHDWLFLICLFLALKI